MKALCVALLLATLVAFPASGSAQWSPPQALSNSALPSRTQYNFAWAIDVDGAGVVHAAWLEVASPDPSGHGTGRVMYSRSGDDGHAWTAPVPLTGIHQPVTGNPRVAASGANVYVAWHGLHDGSGILKIYLTRSHDHGATWQPARIVSDGDSPAAAATWPSVNSCGDAVHVAWADARHGTPEIRLRSSPDAGHSWAPVRHVSSADGFSSWVPSVACRGSEVHVAWSDERHNVDETGAPYDCGRVGGGTTCREEEYYRRSLDFGATWEPEVRLTHDAANSPRASWAPSIALGTGNKVHVVFFDQRGERFQVYYKRSLHGGTAGSWEPERVISHDDGATIHARPVIVSRGNELHLVWFAVRPGIGVDVMHAMSGDGGQGFSPPQPLTARPVMAEAHPSIALSPRGSAHVIWYEPDAHGVDRVVHRARRAAPGRGRGAPAWD